MDVACRVIVRLGSGSIRVQDCLALRPQSVLRLAAPAGGDLDVLVHDVVIGRGEVAIIDDTTSIRLTDLPEAAEEVAP